jgi:hypothetical protein
MIISDMMFSESNYKLMDSDELITEVKQCIKLMKGWTMITITLTDDIQFAVYPRQVHSVRLTNNYGEINMAYCNGHHFDNWKPAKIKDAYDNIKTFVKNANIFQLGKKGEASNTEVATA